jgi:hypothetical protein
MPKRGDDPIPDLLLLSNAVHDLDRDLRLSPRQVHRMTGLSLGDLAEYRRTRPPKRPLAVMSEKKGAKVWYELGEVLDWRKARKPVLQKPSGGIKTFTAFVARGRMEDEWVFARTKEGQLVDFFASLRLGPLLDYGADCEWLTLAEYVKQSKSWANELSAQALMRHLNSPDVLRVANSTTETLCPKCGRLMKGVHRCRF